MSSSASFAIPRPKSKLRHPPTPSLISPLLNLPRDRFVRKVGIRGAKEQKNRLKGIPLFVLGLICTPEKGAIETG